MHVQFAKKKRTKMHFQFRNPYKKAEMKKRKHFLHFNLKIHPKKNAETKYAKM